MYTLAYACTLSFKSHLFYLYHYHLILCVMLMFSIAHNTKFFIDFSSFHVGFTVLWRMSCSGLTHNTSCTTYVHVSYKFSFIVYLTILHHDTHTHIILNLSKHSHFSAFAIDWLLANQRTKFTSPNDESTVHLVSLWSADWLLHTWVTEFTRERFYHFTLP